MQNPPGTGSPASASSPKLAALPPATDSIEARSCAMSATRRSSSAAVIGLLAGSRPVPMALLPSLDDRKSMEPRTTSGCRPAGRGWDAVGGQLGVTADATHGADVSGDCSTTSQVIERAGKNLQVILEGAPGK